MNFVADSLALFGVPAAVLEKHGQFVGANPAMSALFPRLAVTETVEGWTPQMAADELGIDFTALCDQPTYSKHLSDGCTLHASHIEAPIEIRDRPTLILVTVHRGESDEDSWLDHERLIMTVRVNEMSEFTVRALESSIHQAAAAVNAQRTLIAAYNQRMAAIVSGTLQVPKFF